MLKKTKLLGNIIKTKFNDDIEFLKMCMLYCDFCMGICDRLPRNVQLIQLVSFPGSTALSCFGTLISFVNVADTMEKWIAILAFSIHLAYFSLSVYFKFHAKKLRHLFHQPFDEHAPRYIGQEATIIASKHSKRLIIISTSVYVGLMVTSTAAAVFYALLFVNIDDLANSDEVLTFVIPYWFVCADSPVIRICWKVRNPVQFCVVNFLQLVCLFNATNLCLGTLYFFIIVLSGIEARVQIFRSRLTLLATKTAKLSVTKTRILKREFPKIILYQKEIRRFLWDFHPFLNFPILVHVESFFALTVLSSFLFVTKGETSILIRIKAAYYVFLGSLFHYLVCKSSMSMSNMNENLLKSISNFPWYEQEAKFQKSYLIMLTMNQKPLDLKLYGLYQVDLRYFANNMRRIYSLLNLLLLRRF